jgi:Na+-driven multidrug efflux pump
MRTKVEQEPMQICECMPVVFDLPACQPQVLTTLATTLAICVLWANMGPLLLAMGQQQDIARGAARYLLLSTPALLLSGMFECLKRYLMAQVGVATMLARLL